MNHIYRSLWNEITRTCIAAAETVRSKGKSCKSDKTAAASEANKPSRPCAAGFGGFRSMALEPRFMFDGAAVAEAADVLNSPAPDGFAADSHATAAAAILQLDTNLADWQPAAAVAQDQVRAYLATASDEQMFAIFSGGESQPDAAWQDRLVQLRDAINSGEFKLNVVEMDSASQFTAISAFTRNGPNGEPTIFINRAWFSMFDAPDATRALAEEFGHAIDDYLNPATDTQGDEGELFAAEVLGLSLDSSARATVQAQNDSGTVMAGGVAYDVEFASFNFSNAYQMITDVNGDGIVQNTENWAEKEQESHTLLVTSTSPSSSNNYGGLGAVTINDDTNSAQFSGNDVSAIGINIGGTNYYGWISRPLKIQGQVVGFYFWTDQNFTNLTNAQLDGNQDRDGNVTDNKGFILVVDQSYFTGTINAGTTSVNVAASSVWSAVPAGTYNTIEVGSSSDRVDNSLNSLLPQPVPPDAVNDLANGTPGTSGGAALERGTDSNSPSLNTQVSAGILAETIDATGNVLTNDSRRMSR